MNGGYVSSITIDSLGSAFGEGLEQLENNLHDIVNKIQSNPNPSQSDLLMMQMVAAKFQAVVQSETGLVKAYGDMYKAVATNFGV